MPHNIVKYSYGVSMHASQHCEVQFMEYPCMPHNIVKYSYGVSMHASQHCEVHLQSQKFY